MGIRELAEKVYRKENPRLFPYSPWERQRELRDLWPCDQEEYIRRIEIVLKEKAE